MVVQMRLFLSLLFAVFALSTLVPASVQAQSVADSDYWKRTAVRQDTVYRFVYSQSPQSIPSSYDPVREAEGILQRQQRMRPRSNPEAPTVWRQVRTLTVKSARSTAPRALGTIGLAAGTLELGWKIGTGIHTKFVRIGLPDPPALKTSPAQGTLQFREAGYTSAFNTAPLPDDGWLLHWWYGSSQWNSVNLSHGWGHACAYLTGPPPNFRILRGFATVGWCEPPPVPVESYWLDENALEAAGPIEDYTGQAYTKSASAPVPPPQATVEQSIDTELEKPANALLRQWLNYVLGSPGEEDPLRIGERNPDIEFPGFVEHWTDHGEEFTPAYDDPTEYWRDAADIVERGEISDPDILKCVRPSDGAQLYWDSVKRAIVIVKDGKIVTFFKPSGPPPADFDYWYAECSN